MSGFGRVLALIVGFLSLVGTAGALPTATPTPAAGCAWDTFTATTMDQIRLQRNAVYPPTGTPSCSGGGAIERSWSGVFYRIQPMLHRFTVTGLGSDTVLSAHLDVPFTGGFNVDGLEISGDYPVGWDGSTGASCVALYSEAAVTGALSSGGACGSACAVSGLTGSPATASLELDGIGAIADGDVDIRLTMTQLTADAAPAGANKVSYSGMIDLVVYHCAPPTSTPTVTPTITNTPTRTPFITGPERDAGGVVLSETPVAIGTSLGRVDLTIHNAQSSGAVAICGYSFANISATPGPHSGDQFSPGEGISICTLADTPIYCMTMGSATVFFDQGRLALSPIATATATPTQTSIFTPLNTPTKTVTVLKTNTSTPTASFTKTPTFTKTSTPTRTPTITTTSIPTRTPTRTPTETPTETPVDTPTDTPTETPTETPT